MNTNHDMLILGVSGKIGSGKSTLCDYIEKTLLSTNKFNIIRASFGRPLKKETSEIYKFDYSLTMSQKGKLSKIHLNSNEFQDKRLIPNYSEEKINYCYTVRELLQYYGTDYTRNLIDNKYWINAVDREINEKLFIFKSFNTKKNVALIDDVRFINEYDYVANIDNGVTIRLNQSNNDNSYTRIGNNHSSETDLDDHSFDIELNPKRGLQYLAETYEQILSVDLIKNFMNP